MKNDSIRTGSAVIPTVRYRDLTKAVAWLQEAFGFEPHRVVKDSKGSVLYAQLTFGTGMVMLAPIQESPFGKLMVQPDEIGGVETQVCYLFVDNEKAHYARATAAGAEIVLDIEGAAIGGRGYSCRDLEGHVWNFGTHNPWTSRLAAERREEPRRTWTALAACLMLAAATGFLIHTPAREAVIGFALTALGKISATIESAQAEQMPDRIATDASTLTLREMGEQLSKEQLARIAADRHVKDLTAQLAYERRAREAAEIQVRTIGVHEPQPTSAAVPASATAIAADAAAAGARAELAKTRSALQAAKEQLAQAQKAKEAAERAAMEARDQFAQLREAREAAEHAAREMRELAARERKTRIAAQRTLRQAKTSPYTPYPLE